MRPDWDSYFLGLALAVAARADCSRRQVGAVVVRNNRIVSTGYNGSPPGGPSCLGGECPRGLHFAKLDAAGVAYCVCGKHEWPCPNAVEPGSSYDTGPGECIAIHAEMNALLYAGVDGCAGSTLYLTHEPCAGCQKAIAAAGIARIIWITWEGQQQ